MDGDAGCRLRREEKIDCLTPVIARTTRSFVMRPDAARFEMSSALVLPVQRQAMLDEDDAMVESWMQSWRLSQ